MAQRVSPNCLKCGAVVGHTCRCLDELEVEWYDISQAAKIKLQDVILNGPTRIMTVEDVAVLPRRRPHLKWQWIFVRDDGWSLGANEASVYFAHRTWAKQWKWVVIKELTGSHTIVTIDEWRRMFEEGEL